MQSPAFSAQSERCAECKGEFVMSAMRRSAPARVYHPTSVQRRSRYCICGMPKCGEPGTLPRACIVELVGRLRLTVLRLTSCSPYSLYKHRPPVSCAPLHSTADSHPSSLHPSILTRRHKRPNPPLIRTLLLNQPSHLLHHSFNPPKPHHRRHSPNAPNRPTHIALIPPSVPVSTSSPKPPQRIPSAHSPQTTHRKPDRQ